MWEAGEFEGVTGPAVDSVKGDVELLMGLEMSSC